MRRSLLIALLAAGLAGYGESMPVPLSTEATGSSTARTVKATEAKGPVVLELFTSQGCSSCPPADKLATRLSRDPGILVISRPVTYWDRLGWTDSLASPANTHLQRAYARRGLAGYNGVYTPQAVIDGRAGEVGSDAREIAQMIAAAKSRARPSITADGADAFVVSGAAKAGATLSLVGLDNTETVHIPLGENRNRTLTYTNIWQGERTIGEWAGGEKRFVVPASARKIAGANSYALVLRDGKTGAILAGHKIS